MYCTVQYYILVLVPVVADPVVGLVLADPGMPSPSTLPKESSYFRRHLAGPYHWVFWPTDPFLPKTQKRDALQ